MARSQIRGITIEIGGDTTRLDKALDQSDRKLRGMQSDLKKVEDALKLDPGNMDLLAEKQRLLASVAEESSNRLATLTQAAEEMNRRLAEGEIDVDQYNAFNQELILAESRARLAEQSLQDFREELDRLSDSADDADDDLDDLDDNLDDLDDDLDDLDDSADNASDSFGGMSEVVVGAARAMGEMLVSAAIDAVKWIMSLDEATEEYRAEMGKLETAFKHAGYSMEDAKQTYTEFYKLLGDTATATEASQLLANMANREDELNYVTAVLGDTFGVFASSIPVKKLVEAINVAAQTGEVTGALSDALQLAGVNAEQFELQLQKLSNVKFDKSTNAFDDLANESHVANVVRLKQIIDELSISLFKTPEQAKNASDALYKMAKSENELSNWTRIATGVFATFGDALPVEGLIEAANETIKMGQVTGVLADALNWVGENEEDVNNRLQELTYEENRSAYIMGLLTSAYADAADQFNETNEVLLASRETQEQVNDSMARIGESVANIKQGFFNAFGPLLVALLDGVAASINGLAHAMENAGNATEYFLGLLANFGSHGGFGLGESIGSLLVGGKSRVLSMESYSLRPVTAEDLPHLARGTVVRPNNPFLAVVGDNPEEPEVISPYSTIRKAMDDSLRTAGRSTGTQSPTSAVMQVDGRTFARLEVPYILEEFRRLGVKFSR